MGNTSINATEIVVDKITLNNQSFENGANFIITNKTGVVQSYYGNNGTLFSSGLATSVIQASLNSLPVNGGYVLIREGTYGITTNLNIVSNTTLSGVGYATILRFDTEVNLTNAGMIRAVDAINGIDNILIKDMTLDGNKGNQADWTNKFGFYGGHPVGINDHNTLLRLYVHDFSGYGIDPHENSTDINMLDSLIINNGDTVHDGVTFDSIEYGRITGNTVYGNGRHGINIVTGSSNIVVSDNEVRDNGGNGITIQQGSNNNIISNNKIKGNALTGIYVTDVKDNVITQNTVNNNLQHGIKLISAFNNIISSNILLNNSQQTNNGYSEIMLDDDGATFSSNNTVTGNIIKCLETNRCKYSIREDAAGDDFNIITNNNVYGAATTDYSLQGLNSIINYNINLNSGIRFPTTKPTKLLVAGTMFYNTTSETTNCYNGTAWKYCGNGTAT